MEIAFKKDVGSKKPKFSLKNIKFLNDIHSLFYYFWLLVGVGIVFYCSSLFVNYFTTPFTGDYTSQEIAFYTNGWDDWWHFLTTGQFVQFDSNTFLGVNNIGSNSFYYLFSPFFLPILLCPRPFIAQGMAILTIFKNAGAGMAFYAYMRYLGVSRKSSKIAGLAYAFSGWMTWYLWFNHFTDVTIVFPLMLLGVEKVLKDKKPFFLMFAITICGFTNFFFLVSFTMCAFLYAMFRFFQRIKLNSVKENFEILGLGFIGFLIGLLMSCIVVVPGAAVSLTANRVQASNYLDTIKNSILEKNWGTVFSYIFKWDELIIRSKTVAERVYFPLIEFVYPAMTCRGVPLAVYSESYDNIAGSLFVYYPFILLLVPALIKSCREKHFTPLIATVLFVIMLLTPFCYYMFHGFTNEPYSRWSLFVTTSIIAYVGMYLDKLKEDKNWTLYVGLGVTIALIILATVLSHKLILIDNKDNEEIVYELRYTFTERTPIPLPWMAVIACAYVSVVFIAIRIFKNKSFFYRILMGFIALEASLMGAFTIQGHGVENYIDTNNGLDNNNALRKIVEKINKNDKSYFRCYSSLESESARNDGMRNGYNGLGFFHSIYNFDMKNFLNWSEINDYTAPDSWAGSYIEKRINVDAILGVKYYFVEKDYYNYILKENEDEVSPNYRINAPLGFVDISDQYPNDYFYVLENKKHIDFAITLDKVIAYNTEENREDTFLRGKTIENESLYLKYGIFDFDDAVKINGMSSDITFEDEAAASSFLKRLYIYDNPSDPSHYRISYFDITGEEDYDSKTKNYELSMPDLLDISSATTEYEKVSYPGTSCELNDRYVTIIDKPVGDFEYDPNGMIFYVRNCFNWDYRTYVYFVDENNQIITYDDHNNQRMWQNTWYKHWRGFYVSPKLDTEGNVLEPAPKVNRIILVNTGKYVNDYMLYYDSYTHHQEKLDAINAYPVTDVIYKTNSFEFKTNFDRDRVVITQIPYDRGWQIEAISSNGTKEKLEIFNGQGGFVSFVAKKGAVSYSMKYATPYLKLGALISLIGDVLFLGCYSFYFFNKIKGKKFKKLIIE